MPLSLACLNAPPTTLNSADTADSDSGDGDTSKTEREEPRYACLKRRATLHIDVCTEGLDFNPDLATRPGFGRFVPERRPGCLS